LRAGPPIILPAGPDFYAGCWIGRAATTVERWNMLEEQHSGHCVSHSTADHFSRKTCSEEAYPKI